MVPRQKKKKNLALHIKTTDQYPTNKNEIHNCKDRKIHKSYKSRLFQNVKISKLFAKMRTMFVRKFFHECKCPN